MIDNIVSYFDGGSGGQLALKRAGIKFKNYFAYEIKPHALKVTQENFPNTIQMGSVIGADLSLIPQGETLLIGGSPCQSFSRAGDGSGFDGKSKLFWEFIRAKNELKPKYFFLENVKMKKEWQDVITKAIGVEPILINSSLVCGAERERLYWTNIPNITQPENKHIYLKDIVGLKTNIPLKNGIDRIKIIEKVSVRKHEVNIPILQALLKARKKGTIREIAEFVGVPKTKAEHWFRTDNSFSIPDADVWNKLKKCLNIYTNHFDAQICEFIEKDNIFDMSNRVYRINGKAPTLTATNKKVRYIDDEGNIKLLTKSHFEALQTMPKGYLNCLTETQGMNIAGDGWNIDTVAHIFNGLKNHKAEKTNIKSCAD